MSSSSSDSDSDDFEPIRRIKINIKPKDAVAAREGADVETLKASVGSWRPLGPRPHLSLSRRQSSLSSVASLTFGTAAGGVPSGFNNATTSDSANDSTNQYYYQSSFGTAKGNIINQTNNSMRSSPSCSSLVNEFSNRTSFSNLMPNASRTSSPLTFMSSNINSHSDTVPIALAIQESIELTVKGQHRPTFNDSDVKKHFETRALGNIKVAFPNMFARLCSFDDVPNKDPGRKQIPALKLRLHSPDNIIRYYASGLVKDLDSERSSLAESVNTPSNENNNNNYSYFNNSEGSDEFDRQPIQSDPFDMHESPTRINSNTKIIEFDMDALTKHLKHLYDQSPNMRYYNVDVLRYQIAPVDEFEKCPLQVSAYWKVEPALIKLRIDFKHSNQSGFNLERLREVSFIANLDNLIPPNLDIKALTPSQVSTLTRPPSYVNNNTRPSDLGAVMKNDTSNLGNSNNPYSLFGVNNDRISIDPLAPFSHTIQGTNLIDVNPVPSNTIKPISSHTQQSTVSQPQPAPRQLNTLMQMKLPPPPSSGYSRHHHKPGSLASINQKDGNQTSQFMRSTSNNSSNSSARSDVLSLIDGFTNAIDLKSEPTTTNQPFTPTNQPLLELNNATKPYQQASQDTNSGGGNQTVHAPYITFEPQASWDSNTRQLAWKFDNLLSYYKNDGTGSLLAKLDFRHCNEALIKNEDFAKVSALDQSAEPQPVDIKFMVIDSTLSKISLTIDSAGYRMSLLKKEIRSGRYKSEPCTF